MSRRTESVATAQDIAARYRIGAATVRRKVNDGSWPCDRIGRLYRFSPDQQDQIEQIISNNQPVRYDKDRIAEALRQLSF